MLTRAQKAAALAFLRRRAYEKSALLPAEAFLDPKEPFAVFGVEVLDDKAPYLAAVRQLRSQDEGTRVYAQLYDLEEDAGEAYVYADDLLVRTSLSLARVEECLSCLRRPGEPYRYPSQISELTAGLMKEAWLIGPDGELAALETGDGTHIYDCWWD